MPTFAVRLVHDDAWDPTRPIREQDGWDEHAAYMDSLVDEGFVVVGGPVGGYAETLHLVQADDLEHLRTRWADDPWARAGLLRVGSVETWELWLDGRVH